MESAEGADSQEGDFYLEKAIVELVSSDDDEEEGEEEEEVFEVSPSQRTMRCYVHLQLHVR